MLQGRSVCTVTTVGVHRCGGRCTPSVFPRTATDGPHWRRVRLDAHRRVERASRVRPPGGPNTSPVGAGGKGGCADDLRGSGERDACGAGGACAGRPCIRGRGARPGAPVRGRGSTARGRAFRQQYPPQRLGCPGETVTVAVKIGNDVIRVEVTDLSGPGVPEPRRARSDAEDGRGLHLVTHLAARWGWRRRGGRTVTWFEIKGRLNYSRQPDLALAFSCPWLSGTEGARTRGGRRRPETCFAVRIRWSARN
jgi:hypothetical protein